MGGLQAPNLLNRQVPVLYFRGIERNTWLLYFAFKTTTKFYLV